MPPSLRHRHHTTIITAVYHRPLGWCIPIQCDQINAEVGSTFFFEQFVYSRSGLRSLSVLVLVLCLCLFYHLCFFLSFFLFFFYVKFLLLGVPFSFLQLCLHLSLRTTSLEVSLPSLRGTVTF